MSNLIAVHADRIANITNELNKIVDQNLEFFSYIHHYWVEVQCQQYKISFSNASTDTHFVINAVYGRTDREAMNQIYTYQERQKNNYYPDQIKISKNKSDQQIAKEINKRLLTPYMDLMDKIEVIVNKEKEWSKKQAQRLTIYASLLNKKTTFKVDENNNVIDANNRSTDRLYEYVDICGQSEKVEIITLGNERSELKITLPDNLIQEILRKYVTK